MAGRGVPFGSARGAYAVSDRPMCEIAPPGVFRLRLPKRWGAALSHEIILPGVLMFPDFHGRSIPLLERLAWSQPAFTRRKRVACARFSDGLPLGGFPCLSAIGVVSSTRPQQESVSIILPTVNERPTHQINAPGWVAFYHLRAEAKHQPTERCREIHFLAV